MKTFSINELKSMYDTIELNNTEEFDLIKQRIDKDYGGFLEAIKYSKTGNFPISKGFFYIKDYGVSSIFEIIENEIRLKILITEKDDYIPFFQATIDLNTLKISKVCIAESPNKKSLIALEHKDETCLKQFRCIISTLYYMAIYQCEPIETQNTISRSAKKTIERKFNYRKVPLVTKRYVINKERKHPMKRTTTCPSWTVRGHYRHYRNGKVIWIAPCTKGKLRDKVLPKNKTYSGI